jgi:hypothetical protein
MHGVIDISAGEPIVVHVLNLLPHHLIALNLLRVTSLPPDLVLALSLVPQLMRSQLPKSSADAARRSNSSISECAVNDL